MMKMLRGSEAHSPDQVDYTLKIVDIHDLLQQIPLGFSPSSGINDLIWLAKDE